MYQNATITKARLSGLKVLSGLLPDPASKDLRTKFTNICGKTGQYDVPVDLFQKRTARKNRVLISWKTVEKNGLTIDQLDCFEGGVVVEFVNSDYFDSKPDDPTFTELKNRLGSDLNVSSMISIRSEGGTSDTRKPRLAFASLEDTFPDWRDHLIRRKPGITSQVNQGNDKIEGFVYIRIAGGQQDTFFSHQADELLFNPACEYASSSISNEIDLVLIYFALHAKSRQENISKELQREIDNEILVLRSILANCKYETGNLLDYCDSHPSLKLGNGQLFDPIQMVPIYIEDFSITDPRSLEHLNLTHNEAVEHEKFVFDNLRNEILSPARPQNVFWSKHLSNMMQQHLTLSEFFDFQDQMVEKRHRLLSGN